VFVYVVIRILNQLR